METGVRHPSFSLHTREPLGGRVGQVWIIHVSKTQKDTTDLPPQKQKTQTKNKNKEEGDNRFGINIDGFSFLTYKPHLLLAKT